MQLLWKVVTYLLKNVKHETQHDVDTTYGVGLHYRHSWTLSHIEWIPCNLGRWLIWQSVSL